MESSKYMPPCLNIDGSFISASQFLIAQRTNERLARKMDAAKILDELEAELWILDEPECLLPPTESEGARRRRLYRNQAFHFRGEEL